MSNDLPFEFCSAVSDGQKVTASGERFLTTKQHALEWVTAFGDLATRASLGTFTRFLRHWVRERQTVSLMEGISRCSLIPANILAPSTPAMLGKGRLTAGADADVVVFDYETLTDRAEFTAMNRPAEGVKHLVVSGQTVITDGVMDVDIRPGRPVRRPTTGIA